MGIKIDHIGIAVKNADEMLKIYCDILGLKPEEIEMEVIEEQKTRIAIIPVGESKIELLESNNPEGAIAKFIASSGEGIHHIAIGVDNIEDSLAKLKEKGLPLVDEKPKIGAGGSKIAFMHPKAAKALIELVEH